MNGVSNYSVFIQKIFLWGVNCEPHSGVSHGQAPKWLKLETRMADSREWGFGEGAASSPLPPAREECCKLSSGVRGGSPENFDLLHIWNPQNVYISMLRYLKEQKFLGRLGGGRGPRGPPSKYAPGCLYCNLMNEASDIKLTLKCWHLCVWHYTMSCS